MSDRARETINDILDGHWSKRLKNECIYNNANNGKKNADKIIIELLKSMGLGITADTFEDIKTM